MAKTVVLTLALLLCTIVYAEPVQLAQVNNVTTLNGQVAFCLDYDKLSPLGQTLDYTFKQSTNPLHLQAGFIASQVLSGAIPFHIGQAAIWNLSNGTPTPFDISGILQLTSIQNFDGLTANIWTPVNSQYQPFVVGLSQVPEPATLVLLGTGLAVIGRRRRSK
jgi:hypothetical protein